MSSRSCSRPGRAVRAGCRTVNSGTAVGAATARPYSRTAEGNPLFVEQLLQMSARGSGLAARDRESRERFRACFGPTRPAGTRRARVYRASGGHRARVLARGGARASPAEARPSADEHLRSLVHRGLIHPDRSTLAGEEQLRFHHILIRDVAYRSTPKASRERAARAVRRLAGARGERVRRVRRLSPRAGFSAPLSAR